MPRCPHGRSEQSRRDNPCSPGLPGCELAPTLFDELDPRAHARRADPDTSHAAAAQLSSKATMMRHLLARFAVEPHTAERAARTCGYTAENGAWKRVSDLLSAGWIEDTGEREKGSSGREQRVLRITEEGRRAERGAISAEIAFAALGTLLPGFGMICVALGAWELATILMTITAICWCLVASQRR